MPPPDLNLAPHLTTISTTSASWHSRSASLRHLTSLCTTTPLPSATRTAFLSTLPTLTSALSTALTDLRSALVRDACNAITALSHALGPSFAAPASDPLTPSFLHASRITIAVITSASAAAARALYAAAAPAVPARTAALLARSLSPASEKHPAARAAAAAFVGVLLEHGALDALPEDAADALCDAVVAAVADPAAPVRENAREAVRIVHVGFPLRAAAMLDALKPAARAMVLEGEPQKTPAAAGRVGSAVGAGAGAAQRPPVAPALRRANGVASAAVGRAGGALQENGIGRDRVGVSPGRRRQPSKARRNTVAFSGNGPLFDPDADGAGGEGKSGAAAAGAIGAGTPAPSPTGASHPPLPPSAKRMAAPNPFAKRPPRRSMATGLSGPLLAPAASASVSSSSSSSPSALSPTRRPPRPPPLSRTSSVPPPAASSASSASGVASARVDAEVSAASVAAISPSAPVESPLCEPERQSSPASSLPQASESSLPPTPNVSLPTSPSPTATLETPISPPPSPESTTPVFSRRVRSQGDEDSLSTRSSPSPSSASCTPRSRMRSPSPGRPGLGGILEDESSVGGSPERAPSSASDPPGSPAFPPTPEGVREAAREAARKARISFLVGPTVTPGVARGVATRTELPPAHRTPLPPMFVPEDAQSSPDTEGSNPWRALAPAPGAPAARRVPAPLRPAHPSLQSRLVVPTDQDSSPDTDGSSPWTVLQPSPSTAVANSRPPPFGPAHRRALPQLVVPTDQDSTPDSDGSNPWVPFQPPPGGSAAVSRPLTGRQDAPVELVVPEDTDTSPDVDGSNPWTVLPAVNTGPDASAVAEEEACDAMLAMSMDDPVRESADRNLEVAQAGCGEGDVARALVGMSQSHAESPCATCSSRGEGDASGGGSEISASASGNSEYESYPDDMHRDGNSGKGQCLTCRNCGWHGERPREEMSSSPSSPMSSDSKTASQPRGGLDGSPALPSPSTCSTSDAPMSEASNVSGQTDLASVKSSWSMAANCGSQAGSPASGTRYEMNGTNRGNGQDENRDENSGTGGPKGSLPAGEQRKLHSGKASIPAKKQATPPKPIRKHLAKPREAPVSETSAGVSSSSSSSSLSSLANASASNQVPSGRAPRPVEGGRGRPSSRLIPSVARVPAGGTDRARSGSLAGAGARGPRRSMVPSTSGTSKPLYTPSSGFGGSRPKSAANLGSTSGTGARALASSAPGRAPPRGKQHVSAETPARPPLQSRSVSVSKRASVRSETVEVRGRSTDSGTTGRQFADALKAVEMSKTKNWEGKVSALRAFQAVCQKRVGYSLDTRLAARTVAVLSEMTADTHNRVVACGLDAFFHMLLGVESPSEQTSASPLQLALDRKPEILLRILTRLADSKEPVRVAAERVMHSVTAQFRPEVRVLLIIRAISFSFSGSKGRAKAGVTNPKMAVVSCSHLVAAFEAAEASGEGFVWQPVALLSSLLETMATLLRDRRTEVRKAAGPVVVATEHSLPAGAMELALDSLPLAEPDRVQLQQALAAVPAREVPRSDDSSEPVMSAAESHQ